MEIVGDVFQVKDGEMIPKTESIELWMRNPVECVKELLEDPRFKDDIRYAPEKMFTDETMRVRAIDEMWTGDWWWATQVCKLSQSGYCSNDIPIETRTKGRNNRAINLSLRQNPVIDFQW